MGKTFLATLCLQLRLCIKPLLVMLAVSLAALLAGGAVSATAGALLAGRGFSPLTLALAPDEADERLDEFLPLITDMQDIAGYAEFIFTTPEQATGLVQEGQADAAIILPAGFFDSVMTGENLSPQLVVNTSRPLETMLAGSVAQSFVSMLSSAQNGIAFTLAVYDLYRPASPSKADVVQQVNLAYATWVLGRSAMYNSEVTSPTGALPIGNHYLLGGLLYFIILACPLLYPLFSLRRQQAWVLRLRSAGLPLAMYAVCQILCGSLVLLVSLAVLTGGAGIMAGGSFSLPFALGMLLCAFTLSCFAWLCCNAGNIMPAVVLPFIVGTIGLFVSGGLLPQVLLPQAIAQVSPYSLFGALRSVLGTLYGLQPSALAYITVVLACLFAFFACLLRARRAERRQVV